MPAPRSPWPSAASLDLDAPLARWLPDLPQSERITVRMLLRHRSGLPEYFRDDRIRRKMQAQPQARWSRDELLEAAARLGSERAPDERFAYRNTNYIALGELLERLTERGIGDLVHERVTEPLGLSTLSFAADEHRLQRLASPHTRRFIRVARPLADGSALPSHVTGEVWTDGGLACSADDLAMLTESLFEGRLLQPATVDDMTGRSASAGSAVGGVLGALQRIYLGPVQRSYGLGVAIEQRGQARTMGHEGMYYGWSATTTYDPSTRVTVTVVTNLAAIPVPAERLERSLRDAVEGMPGEG